MFKTFENQKDISLNLLKKILPFSESSILRTASLLEKTNTDEEEFRNFFYKTIFEEDYKNINFKDKSISGFFYWFSLIKITKEFINFEDQKNLFEYILVNDSVEPPVFMLSDTDFHSKKSELKIKRFLIKFIDMFKNTSKYNNTELFNWICIQIISDIILYYYTFCEIELFPNTILKYNNSELSFFKLNTKEIDKLVKQIRSFTTYKMN